MQAEISKEIDNELLLLKYDLTYVYHGLWTHCAAFEQSLNFDLKSLATHVISAKSALHFLDS